MGREAAVGGGGSFYFSATVTRYCDHVTTTTTMVDDNNNRTRRGNRCVHRTVMYEFKVGYIKKKKTTKQTGQRPTTAFDVMQNALIMKPPSGTPKIFFFLEEF